MPMKAFWKTVIINLPLIQEKEGNTRAAAKKYKANNIARLRYLKYLVLASMLVISPQNLTTSSHAWMNKDCCRGESTLGDVFHNTNIKKFESILQGADEGKVTKNSFAIMLPTCAIVFSSRPIATFKYFLIICGPLSGLEKIGETKIYVRLDASIWKVCTSNATVPQVDGWKD